MKVYAIIDRDTGAFYNNKFKIYKSKASAKGVLTSNHIYGAPEFAFAVVEMELETAVIIPEHKLTETEFNKLVDEEQYKLDEAHHRDPANFDLYYEEEVDMFKRFHSRYADIKHI